MAQGFSVSIMGAKSWDPMRDNLDIVVVLADGRRYGATFFAEGSIRRLFEQYESSGECASGTYVWASNMVIVQRLTLEVIERTVETLIEEKEFHSVFAALASVDETPDGE